jgi:hypothetical protein
VREAKRTALRDLCEVKYQRQGRHHEHETKFRKKCFVENVQLFANAQTEPEKYNLYVGPANLAEGIADMEAELSSIRRELQQLQATVRR